MKIKSGVKKLNRFKNRRIKKANRNAQIVLFVYYPGVKMELSNLLEDMM